MHEKSNLETFDGVIGQLESYINRLTRSASDGILADLFGRTAQDWRDYGRRAGLNDTGLEKAKNAVGAFFDTVLARAELVHGLVAPAHKKWEDNKETRRQSDVTRLKESARQRQREAQPGDPNATITRELWQLREYQAQLEATIALARTWTTDDETGASAARSESARLGLSGRIDELRHEHVAHCMAGYATRSQEAVQALRSSEAELAKLAPEDATYEPKKKAHDRLAEYVSKQVAGSYENEAMAVFDQMCGTARGHAQTEDRVMRRAPRPPKWWRSRIPKYRRFLKFSLFVAVCGELLVMNQLTGSYLNLVTLTDALAGESRSLFTEIPKLAKLSGEAWMGGLMSVLSYMFQAVFALLFGLLPLLLSLPVRFHLDKCEEKGEEPELFNSAFKWALGAFLLAVFVAAFLEGRSLPPVLAALENLDRAIALPAMTLLLVLASGWLIHTLASEKEGMTYRAFLVDEEATRLRKHIDDSTKRIASITDAAGRAERDILDAEERHVGEDAFASALHTVATPVDQGVSALRAYFDKAKAAAQRVVEEGYAYGLRIREQGGEMTGDTEDNRRFDDLLDLYQRRMLEAALRTADDTKG